jgi:hypothetical protein
MRPSKPLEFQSRAAFAMPWGDDMGALALAMFIGLYGFGQELIGYSDSDGKVKLAVFVAFMLGIVCGYRTGK